MNFYIESQVEGELWLRNNEGVVVSATEYLSSVYCKYSTINSVFYSDLILNKIEKFDVFYDSFYIQTANGYIFEKITYKDSQILPYNQFNLFNPKNNTNIDYWFDEKLKKVYFCDIINYIIENSSNIKFYFKFSEFDINQGTINVLLSKQIVLSLNDVKNWNDVNANREDPRLTFNNDTNTFNVSFLIRDSAGNIGILSINHSTDEIYEINGYVPSGSIDQNFSSIVDI